MPQLKDKKAGESIDFHGQQLLVKTRDGMNYIEESYEEQLREIPIPKELRSVQFDGNTYPVKLDGKGTPYITAPRSQPVYELPIPKDLKEIKIKDKTFKVRQGKDGKPFYIGDGPYYQDQNLPVSGAGELGTDSIGVIINKKTGEDLFSRLKKWKYIPQWVEMQRLEKDEKIDGHKTRSGNFDSLEAGVHSAVGLYAFFKRQLSVLWNRYYRKGYLKGGLNKSFEKIRPETQFYWASLYYNATTRIRKNSIRATRGVPKKTKETGEAYSRRAFVNASRRLSSYLLLSSWWESQKILKKSPSEEELKEINAYLKAFSSIQ